MSDSGEVQQNSYDPNKKQPDKERIQIPAWWSIVGLIMVGLVFLPIQYAKLHEKKPAAQEEAAVKQDEKPAAAAQEAPQSKQDAAKAEQAKPAPEPASEAKPAEKAAPVAPAAPQPKQDVVKAVPLKPAPAAETKQVETPAPAAPTTPAKLDIKKAEQAKPAPQQAAEPKAASLKAPGEKQKIEDAVSYLINGKDGQGREAAFTFIVLTNGYSWAKGSSGAVILGGKVVPSVARLFSPKLREALAQMSDVITVGVLADEGRRAEEEARALARSKTAAAWVKSVVKPDTSLWTLTLGQFAKTCTAQDDKDLSFDQPFVLVGVRSKAEGASLQEALADAIGGRAKFPGRECYSRFDMAKIR